MVAIVALEGRRRCLCVGSLVWVSQLGCCWQAPPLWRLVCRGRRLPLRPDLLLGHLAVACEDALAPLWKVQRSLLLVSPGFFEWKKALLEVLTAVKS